MHPMGMLSCSYVLPYPGDVYKNVVEKVRRQLRLLAGLLHMFYVYDITLINAMSTVKVKFENGLPRM